MRSRWLLLATGVYALAVSVIGWWKTPVDRGVPTADLPPVRWMADLLGLRPWEAYDVVEAAANVALFVPLGVLALLWQPAWSWLHAVALALLTTSAIEMLQQLLRPERFASLGDVVANTLGGAVGGLLVVIARQTSRTSEGRGAAQVAVEPATDGSPSEIDVAGDHCRE